VLTPGSTFGAIRSVTLPRVSLHAVGVVGVWVGVKVLQVMVHIPGGRWGCAVETTVVGVVYEGGY